MAKTQKYRKHTAGDSSRSSRGKRSRASRSSSNSLQLIHSSGKPSIKNEKNKIAIKKFHTTFVINKRLPMKNDIPTDEEIENYFSNIGENQKNSFNMNGHLLVCSLLKMVHNDSNIDTVVDSLSFFNDFTSNQKKDIGIFIKLIFHNKSSRVQELSSRSNSQKGGNILQSVYLKFCFLLFIAQTFYYYCYMTHICNKLTNIDNKLKQIPQEFDKFLKLTGNTSIEEIYTEVSNVSVDDRWLKTLLNNVVYPGFMLPSVYNTPEFKKNTDRLVMYISVLNHGIYTYIQEPSESITNLFSKTAIEKKRRNDEKLFREYLDNKVQMMKVSSVKHMDYFYDGQFYTKKDHKAALNEVEVFKNTLNQLLIRLERNDESVSLKDDKNIKDMLETLERISNRIDERKNKLEDTLNNLSESRDIAIITPDPDYYGPDYRENLKNTAKTANKMMNDALGITALKQLEKYASTAITSLYNGYVEPYLQSFIRLKKTIESVIGTLNSNVDTIKSIINRLKSFENTHDIMEGLKAMPTQLTLLISLFDEISNVIPGLMWYLGIVGSMLFSLLPNISEKEEKKKRGTSRLSNSRSKSSSRSKSPSRSKNEFYFPLTGEK